MDSKHLAPTYAKIFEKYISNDEKAIMWFEPVVSPDIDGWLNGGTVYPVGFKTPPGGKIGSANHVLNDHTYCCQLGGNPSPCASGEPDPALADECLVWHKKRIGTRNSDAERLGIPYHITEFGACLTEGPCTQEITQVCDVADEYLVGWAYWQFKYYADLTTSAGTGSEGFYNADGSLQDWKAKALSRSYLQFTQGVLMKQNFNTKDSSLTASFKVDTSIQAPTFIYQNTEYWCGEAGCACSYSENGTALPENSYFAFVNGQITELKITDASFNGKTIDVTCSKKEPVRIVQA